MTFIRITPVVRPLGVFFVLERLVGPGVWLYVGQFSTYTEAQLWADVEDIYYGMRNRDCNL